MLDKHYFFSRFILKTKFDATENKFDKIQWRDLLMERPPYEESNFKFPKIEFISVKYNFRFLKIDMKMYDTGDIYFSK